ncbi:MAG: hypothetical protein ACFFCS_29725, partial [Candidatus Hodarchaeota archaeon]
MPDFKFKKFIKQDLAQYREMSVNNDLLIDVEAILKKFHEKFLSCLDEKGNKETLTNPSWELVEKLESLLNVNLEGEYFGTKLAHPFMVAPGKHTRVGRQDPLRLIKSRVAEGWGGIVLKTVVGDDGAGNCSALDNRGDVYWPVLKNIDEHQFISAERGSKLNVNSYTREFLKPAMELGESTRSVMIPSILCPVPVSSYKDEWTSTLQRIHAHSRI